MFDAKALHEGKPLALEGTTRAQRTVLAGETDLVTHRHIRRCSMQEQEHCFRMIEDDPEQFGSGRLSEIERNTLRHNIESIEQAGVLWNLAECLFRLPAYFAFKFRVVRKLSAAQATGQASWHVSRDECQSQVRYGRFKIVSALDVVLERPAVVRAYRPPLYSVEVEGFWRRLAPLAEGKGPDGTPTLGKTWVRAHHRWRERPSRPQTILVKSSVAAARLKAQAWDAAPAMTDDEAAGPRPDRLHGDSGELYVLRCPVMNEEIYKIGWTGGSAEERARTLSAQTGVALGYVVVEAWPHAKARELERAVHVALSPYRFNPRREFFKAPYATIHKAIVGELAREPFTRVSACSKDGAG
jgi:hypothetical protein